MISVFYNTLLLLGAICLFPGLFCKWVLRKDRSIFSYLGIDLPSKRSSQAKCFLLYAVSVGEVKALGSLYAKIKQQYPDADVFIATRTITGQEEAKRSLPVATGYFLLPFDFSWTVRRLYNLLNPTAVVVVEGDLWYHFLQEAKRRNIFTCLVSGKISKRSYERFKKVSFFSKSLFSCFSAICAQNDIFAQRFLDLGAQSTFITGNLKLQSNSSFFSVEEKVAFKEKLGIASSDFVVAVGSTHAPEEEKIVEKLLPLWNKYPNLKCFIVPRHPTRFAEVNHVLSQKGVSFISYSKLVHKTGLERLICIDEMGILTALYQVCDVAIVAGSFCPFLKGHNIIEPIQQGAPVLFGPYMEDQIDFVNQVLESKAGLQVDLDSIACQIESFLNDPARLVELKARGEELVGKLHNSAQQTAQVLFFELEKHKKNHF